MKDKLQEGFEKYKNRETSYEKLNEYAIDMNR